jgi:hypothetical protein
MYFELASKSPRALRSAMTFSTSPRNSTSCFLFMSNHHILGHLDMDSADAAAADRAAIFAQAWEVGPRDKVVA